MILSVSIASLYADRQIQFFDTTVAPNISNPSSPAPPTPAGMSVARPCLGPVCLLMYTPALACSRAQAVAACTGRWRCHGGGQ